MAVKGPITSVRFLDRKNLASEHQLFKNYFREIIHNYGIDVTYFRHDNGFFEEPSGFFIDYTYGEKPTMTYFLSASLILFAEMQSDSIILNKFGIETDGDATCFILVDDFTEQFRDLIGTTSSYFFTTTLTGTVTNYNAFISGSIINTDISGFTSATSDFSSTTGVVSSLYTGTFIRTPKKYIDLVYKSPSYTNQIVTGNLSGSYNATINVSGNGYVSGFASGNLIYHISDDAGKYGAPNWKIAPQVGDFYRIDFDEINHEEWEISKVHDKDLMAGGLNPLLSRYVWRCNVVRRDPSYETVVGQVSGTKVEEEQTSDRKKLSDLNEVTSNEIFSYEAQDVDSIDKKNSDSVYGDYDSDVDLNFPNPTPR